MPEDPAAPKQAKQEEPSTQPPAVATDDTSSPATSPKTNQEPTSPTSAAEEAPRERTSAPEKEEILLRGKKPNNRINVASNQPTRTYMTRAKKILRSHPTLTIGALGMAMSIAVELAEMLVQSNYAVKQKVQTSYVGKSEQSQLKGPRKPCIEITLKRGIYGDLVSGYRQRKVTDLFEKLALKTNDGEFPANVQYLKKDVITEQKFHERFHSSEEHLENSKTMLGSIDGDSLDLPTYIRYMSKLIDPLLLDRHFNNVMRNYGVEVPDRKIPIHVDS